MVLKKAGKKKGKPWLIPVLVLAVFAGLIGLLLKLVLSESGAKPQKQVQIITLIKPPPEVKEKLPEPEVPKEAPKQVVEVPSEAPATPQNNAPDADDSPPAGDNLAVDGDGGAGDNAFGLGAKKGGRAITLGGSGGGGGSGLNRLSLLSKYSGYARKMQSDIEKQVKKVLEREGGRPKGKQQTLVKLTLAPDGTIIRFAIVGSSGVERLDAAFRTALNGLKLSEPPPEGMPNSMTVKITTQG
jgi:periplasmic protein TonB